jgi:hypothetical protein
MFIATVQRLYPKSLQMSIYFGLMDGGTRCTIYYGIAGCSACVPSAPRRLPMISPRNCLRAGTSSILLSRSIPRLLRETKRLCGVVYVNTTVVARKFGFLYLSVARRDVRDGCDSDLCSWQGIAQAVWISHPTSDRVLGRL